MAAGERRAKAGANMTTDYSTLFDLMHLGGGTWRMKQSLCCCERDERVGPLARATAFRGTLIKLWIEEQSSPPFFLPTS